MNAKSCFSTFFPIFLLLMVLLSWDLLDSNFKTYYLIKYVPLALFAIGGLMYVNKNKKSKEDEDNPDKNEYAFIIDENYEKDRIKFNRILIIVTISVLLLFTSMIIYNVLK